MNQKSSSASAEQLEQLEQLRHSAAHLLAAAVLELRPEAKLAIGPATDDGFYYDFDFGNESLTDADFPKLEKKMAKLVQSWKGFEQIEVSADEARARFAGNEYKLELIEEIT
ncbi:MAG: threonine--tRNA ligase, partial [Patescibacteria group bacterium]